MSKITELMKHRGMSYTEAVREIRHPSALPPPEPQGHCERSCLAPCSAVFREYAAMQLYRMSCPDNHLPVRWGCLHEDLRKRYLETADAAVKEWADGEEAARLRREKANRRFFCSEPNAKDLPRP